jgi:hypothetical protein
VCVEKCPRNIFRLFHPGIKEAEQTQMAA